MHPYALTTLGSVYVKLRMCYGKHPIQKQIFPPVAPDGSKSALITYTQRMYAIVMFFIHWRSKNERQRELSFWCLTRGVLHFSSEALKGGKIVKISSLKAFLMLRSICGVDSYTLH